MIETRWKEVADAARGERKDYSMEPKPLSASGGQGTVYRAIHKATGIPVALKRRKSHTEDAVARMRREIEIGQALVGSPGVMPVIDAASDSSWFCMPLGSTTLQDSLSQIQGADQAIRELVAEISEGLEPAHQAGWIHRDIKPANIIELDGRWVVADWGIVRRPLGQTTNPDRTRSGVFLGSERYAAPELYDDAHHVTVAADIFSIGCIIAWLVTGEQPKPQTPHLPAVAPWRAIVRSCVAQNPLSRPQSLEALAMLIERSLKVGDSPPEVRAGAARQAIEDGDRRTGVGEMWAVIAELDPDWTADFARFIPLTEVHRLVAADRDHALAVVDHFDATLESGRYFDFARVSEVEKLLLEIAKTAIGAQDHELAELAVRCLLSWDAHFDRWDAQKQISSWLGSLRGAAALLVADCLDDNPESAIHFRESIGDSSVDSSVRGAISRSLDSHE